jgi:HrpA-like RNA helicase
MRVNTCVSALQDSNGELTAKGRKMARLPLEPPLAAALLAAGGLGCAGDAAAVAAMLSVDRVFVTPPSQCGPCTAAGHCFWGFWCLHSHAEALCRGSWLPTIW